MTPVFRRIFWFRINDSAKNISLLRENLNNVIRILFAVYQVGGGLAWSINCSSLDRPYKTRLTQYLACLKAILSCATCQNLIQYLHYSVITFLSMQPVCQWQLQNIVLRSAVGLNGQTRHLYDTLSSDAVFAAHEFLAVSTMKFHVRSVP
jgi:hypothetical protein